MTTWNDIVRVGTAWNADDRKTQGRISFNETGIRFNEPGLAFNGLVSGDYPDSLYTEATAVETAWADA